MFRMATCNDYVALKRKYRSLYTRYGYEWSLKELGSLFIYDTIMRNGFRRVLEFGPGFNVFFSDVLAREGIEYWCIDRHGSGLGIGTDDKRSNDAIAHRSGNGHHHVEGLLGDSVEQLPSGHFDLVFSISVVEHIPEKLMGATIDDARRILNPGGILLNTVDVYHGSNRHRHWHGECRKATFDVPGPHDLEWCFSGNRTTFLERQDVRYLVYNSIAKRDVWDTELPYNSQFASALHMAVFR